MIMLWVKKKFPTNFHEFPPLRKFLSFAEGKSIFPPCFCQWISKIIISHWGRSTHIPSFLHVFLIYVIYTWWVFRLFTSTQNCFPNVYSFATTGGEIHLRNLLFMFHWRIYSYKHLFWCGSITLLIRYYLPFGTKQKSLLLPLFSWFNQIWNFAIGS